MGKVMECGAQCGWPKSKEAFATVWDDKFEILPLQHFSKCSPQSLAAHSLYENPRPDLHAGPVGVLDLTSSQYEQTGPRSAGASGAKFHVSGTYTVKLEGAKILGYRSIWMGSFRDPVLISQIDDFLDRLRTFLIEKFPDIKFDIALKPYGKNGTMGPVEPDPTVAKEIFLLGDIQTEDQVTATQIANAGRVFCIHAPYEGQISTTGNFAMPLTNLEIPLGPVSCFNIYHLLSVDDTLALFPWSVEQVGPSSGAAIRDSAFGFDLIKPDPKESVANGTIDGTTNGTNGINGASAHAVTPATTPLIRDQTPVTSLARDIRSKNAGPYEISFDFIFSDRPSYDFARGSPKLTAEALAPLWRARAADIIFCGFDDASMAFKMTLPRPWRSGAFGERDLHCSQQHVPLLNLVL